MRYGEVREQVVDMARRMLADGLVSLTAGNLSVRIPSQELIAITPSGRPYDTMRPEDVAIVTLDGRFEDGKWLPSSETPMHTMVLASRPDLGAVIHTHSPYALAFAVAQKPLPMVCLEGLPAHATSILVAEYGLPGSAELGRKALQTLDKQPGSLAVLLANHGLLAAGKSLEQAYSVALKTEIEAQIYLLARSIGTPVALTESQIEQIRLQYSAG